MTRIRVKKNAEQPESKEVLAESIIKIGEAADALRNSGLNEDAIVILLQSKIGVPRGEIRAVLSGLRQLRGWYCR